MNQRDCDLQVLVFNSYHDGIILNDGIATQKGGPESVVRGLSFYCLDIKDNRSTNIGYSSCAAS